MRNIRITLAYEGTAYSGFQRQENSITVQEILETALQKLTGTKTTLYFVARTDAGVHAYGQECTFYTESSIPGDRFIFALNILLPPDIRVTESREVPYDFSVRRNNYGKTYGYLLTEEKDCPPFFKRYAWQAGRKLDISKMEKAAEVIETYVGNMDTKMSNADRAVLSGTHDFTSFRGNNSVPASPVRTIHDIRIIKKHLFFHIFVTGEGFLYHMVRNIAGALADAGTGKLTPKDLREILEAKDRKFLGATAPAHGLCLLKVYFTPVTKELTEKTICGSYAPWSV